METPLHHALTLPASLQRLNHPWSVGWAFVLALPIMAGIYWLTPGTGNGWEPVFLGIAVSLIIFLFNLWGRKELEKAMETSEVWGSLVFTGQELILEPEAGEMERIPWAEVFRVDVYHDLGLKQQGILKLMSAATNRSLRIRVTTASGSRSWLLRFSGKEDQATWQGELKKFTRQHVALYPLIQVWKAENQA